MDEQRMKENGVPLLHHEVHSGVVSVIVLDSMEHDVNSSLEHIREATSVIEDASNYKLYQWLITKSKGSLSSSKGKR